VPPTPPELLLLEPGMPPAPPTPAELLLLEPGMPPAPPTPAELLLVLPPGKPEHSRAALQSPQAQPSSKVSHKPLGWQLEESEQKLSVQQSKQTQSSSRVHTPSDGGQFTPPPLPLELPTAADPLLPAPPTPAELLLLLLVPPIPPPELLLLLLVPPIPPPELLLLLLLLEPPIPPPELLLLLLLLVPPIPPPELLLLLLLLPPVPPPLELEEEELVLPLPPSGGLAYATRASQSSSTRSTFAPLGPPSAPVICAFLSLMHLQMSLRAVVMTVAGAGGKWGEGMPPLGVGPTQPDEKPPRLFRWQLLHDLVSPVLLMTSPTSMFVQAPPDGMVMSHISMSYDPSDPVGFPSFTSCIPHSIRMWLSLSGQSVNEGRKLGAAPHVRMTRGMTQPAFVQPGWALSSPLISCMEHPEGMHATAAAMFAGFFLFKQSTRSLIAFFAIPPSAAASASA
jgi:hypothetical protein